MREIVLAQIGQCGNRMGVDFWEKISGEHNIDHSGTHFPCIPPQSDYASVYFREEVGGRLAPRAVLVDSEPTTLDSLQARAAGRLFKPRNFVLGQGSAGNTWAKGYYGEGADVVERGLEAVRREIEDCDCLQGLQFCHSIGGGTGAGAGTLLISELKERFSDRIAETFTVFPSKKVSDAVVEPYNAILSVNKLIEVADAVMVLDNEALFSMAARTLGVVAPTYSQMNALVASAMSGLTCSSRFQTQGNRSLRKLIVNLVPFPRTHFCIIGHSPRVRKVDEEFRENTLRELTESVFSAENMMCCTDPRHGRYLSAAVMYRGSGISLREIDDELASLCNEQSACFTAWTSRSVLSSVCNTGAGATLAGNSTAVQRMLQRIAAEVAVMYRKKMFVSSFLREGLEEMEFVEAESNLLDLIAEYQQHEDVPTDYDLS